MLKCKLKWLKCWNVCLLGLKTFLEQGQNAGFQHFSSFLNAFKGKIKQFRKNDRFFNFATLWIIVKTIQVFILYFSWLFIPVVNNCRKGRFFENCQLSPNNISEIRFKPYFKQTLKFRCCLMTKPYCLLLAYKVLTLSQTSPGFYVSASQVL